MKIAKIAKIAEILKIAKIAKIMKIAKITQRNVTIRGLRPLRIAHHSTETFLHNKKSLGVGFLY